MQGTVYFAQEGRVSINRLILIKRLDPTKPPTQEQENYTHDQNHVSDSGLNNGLQGDTSVNYTGSFLHQLIHPDSFTGVYEN